MLKKIRDIITGQHQTGPEIKDDLQQIADAIEAGCQVEIEKPVGAELERIDDVPEDGNPGFSYRIECPEE